MNGATIGHGWKLNRGHKSCSRLDITKTCLAKTTSSTLSWSPVALSFDKLVEPGMEGGSRSCHQSVTPLSFHSLSCQNHQRWCWKQWCWYSPPMQLMGWEVCNDFDGDDDYADRCLGRQSQGGGGATLMSSCPQPKPTPYTCPQCSTYIHMYIAHSCPQPKPTPHTCPQCSRYIYIHYPQLPKSKTYTIQLPTNYTLAHNPNHACACSCPQPIPICLAA